MAARIWRPVRGARALARRDARFAELLDVAGPPAIPQDPSCFETIASAIVHQQLAGPAAGAIWQRLLALFPGSRLDAEAALRKRDTTYRKAGLSGAKAASFRDLAQHIVDGRLVPEDLPGMTDAAVVEALTQVRGIGPWSAHMHLIFSLARPDVWPTGDLGVRRGWQMFTAAPDEPTERELEPLGDRFKPYRTILAWYMWRIHDVGEWA